MEMSNDTENKNDLVTDSYIVEKRTTSITYDVTLSENIEHPPFKYNKLCTLLRDEVDENDIVNVHISNYGGSCDSAATIVNAMKDCEGSINCIVHAPSYSAATMIALAGDTLELKPYSFLMFHNFSTTERGKGAEIKGSILNAERVIHSMMRSLYKGFLSELEISNLFQDKDTYVHWDDADVGIRINKQKT